MEYTGYTISDPPSPGKPFGPRLGELKEIYSSEEFFTEYISRRRPVVIKNYLAQTDWRVKLWNKEYLKKMVGDVRVTVEKRSSSEENFGKSFQERMTFSAFLNAISTSDRYYLTSQHSEIDEDGKWTEALSQVRENVIITPPLEGLLTDFPLRPEALRSLIPQSFNLWIGGGSIQGTSSGLHHDFHDNLYVLVKGKKRFRMFSPQDAYRMGTNGVIQNVFSNGRIAYEGDRVREDGAPAGHADCEDEQVRIETEMIACEDEVRARELEEEMDGVLDRMLMLEGAEGEFGYVEDLLLMEGEEEEILSESEEEEEKEDEESDPLSFCNMDLSRWNTVEDWEALVGKYPKLEGSRPVYCELEEGDALYLPTGWFHEVTSFGDADHTHLALNFWYHPPDALDNVESPYTSDYWKRRWDTAEDGLYAVKAKQEKALYAHVPKKQK